MKPNFVMSIKLPKMKFGAGVDEAEHLDEDLAEAVEDVACRRGTAARSAAKAICSATPVSDQAPVTRFLLSENSQAMPSRTDRPNRPKRIGSNAIAVFPG